jgi:flavin-binding protein dodecin
MILTAGQTNVEKLLSGDAAGKKFISISVGTNGTPEASTDNAITNGVIKAIATIDYLDGYVQFNTTLDAGDPAMQIQEIGLFNQDGILCYRKVVPPVNKIAGTTYALSYKIKVQ